MKYDLLGLYRPLCSSLFLAYYAIDVVIVVSVVVVVLVTPLLPIFLFLVLFWYQPQQQV